MVPVIEVVTPGRVTFTTGASAYPCNTPAVVSSIPGGKIPDNKATSTGFDGSGLEYVIGNWTQVLSIVLRIFPGGVINAGIADPDTFIENVLSRRFPKLSVARIVNVDVVNCVTRVGVPDINPVDEIVIPAGNSPLNRIYVMVVAGVTAVAETEKDMATLDGYVPSDPAGVLHTG